MTLSLQIVKLLADGRLRSVDEISVALDVPREKVKNSLAWLGQKDMLNASFKYELTPAGVERSKFEKKPLEQIRQDFEQKREKRAHWGKQQRHTTNSIVESALSNRPALAMVWGMQA